MQNKDRKSIRLKDFDYSSPNDYFITICTYNRECLFGEIVAGEMVLNEVGKIVQEEILKTIEIRKNILIEIYLIMPNHLHLIITILCNDDDMDCRGELHSPMNETGRIQYAPTGKFKSPSQTIGAIIRGFKGAITRRSSIDNIFQRNYHEHIIRNEKSYDEIYSYIESNVSTWDRDRNNPKNIVSS